MSDEVERHAVSNSKQDQNITFIVQAMYQKNLFRPNNNVVKMQNRCLFWELNPGPTDLQSDALPSELNRHTETYMYTCPRPAYESNSNIFSTPNTKKCIYH
ncbi:Hypothetical_protein [Hexamita inflata]|uniref:Hypothetical_protein n=1 Tax=Hexamita inflata TaxID=28002 RepID=A0AA86V5H0_9EUKA|nr:Hypothetical protein HINF_LOCUS64831 [Hexamita inflata]